MEMNPVRAGMVITPDDYRWSSFGTNGNGLPSGFIKPHDTFLRLGSTPEERQKTYRALFGVPISEEEISKIRSAIQRNRPLGDDAFVMEVERLQSVLAEPLLNRPQAPVPHLAQVPGPYLAPVLVS